MKNLKKFGKICKKKQTKIIIPKNGIKKGTKNVQKKRKKGANAKKSMQKTTYGVYINNIKYYLVKDSKILFEIDSANVPGAVFIQFSIKVDIFF